MSGLRESKKLATKLALAEAAAAIVATRGEDLLTVAEIAKEAGVSTRTFHNYFNSREEALVEFIRQSIEAILTEMEKLPVDTDIVTSFEVLVHRMISGSFDSRYSLSTLVAVGQFLERSGVPSPKNEFQQQQLRLTEYWQGKFPDVNEELLFFTLHLAAHTAALCLSRNCGPDSALSPEKQHDIATQAFDLLRAGTVSSWGDQ